MKPLVLRGLGLQPVMVARIVRTWRQCGDVAALAEWIAPIEQAMSAAPASGSGNSGPHWRAPAGRAVRRQAQGPLLLERPSATVCVGGCLILLSSTKVANRQKWPYRRPWVWPSFNPTYWNYLGWPARQASGPGARPGLGGTSRVDSPDRGGALRRSSLPGAEHRADLADAEEDRLQALYRANPCAETARDLLRARARDRLASLDHDRELAERFGLTL